MSYTIKEVTIHADSSDEGLAKIADLWKDVLSGKIPVLAEGSILVARYFNYASADPLEYDFSIASWNQTVVRALNEETVSTGRFMHFSACANCEVKAVKEAWDLVYAAEARGTIRRAYANDYEITTRPGDADIDKPVWCELYISVNKRK